MAYLQTLGDLVHNCLTQAGEGLDGTDDTDFELRDQVVIWINRAYRMILQARTDWKFLRADPPASFVMLPAIDTGTVNVEQNSTLVTLTDDPGDVEGWFFRVDGCSDIFRVVDQNNEELTLDAVFTGTTDTAASYTLFKLEYDLADYTPLETIDEEEVHMTLVRVIDPMMSRFGEVTCISPADMQRDFPMHYVQAGVPMRYCYVTETKVRFNTSPIELLKIDFNFNFRPADLVDDGDEPVLPLEKRHLLSDLALATLLDTKADSRADKWLQLANNNIQYYISEYAFEQTRQNPNYFKLFPHPEQMSRYNDNRWNWEFRR